MNKTKNRTKQNRIINSIALILMAIFNVVAFLLGSKIATMGVLPWKYMLLFIAVVILIDVITWNAMKNKAITIIMSLLMAVISFVLVYGYGAVLKVDSTIHKMTAGMDKELMRISLIVRADDGALSPADLEGYRIGVPSGSNYVWTVIDSVGENTRLGTVTEYPGIIEMAAALNFGEVDALILNTAYVEIINDFEGFDQFSLNIREIYSTELEIDVMAEKLADSLEGESFTGMGENIDETFTTIETSDTVDLEDESFKNDSLILYISGIDTWGNVNVRSRSDVNILAVINTETGKLLMINTPRDSYVKLVTKNDNMDKLTHAGLYGIDCSMSALEELYGIDIDYYVRLNFSGFQTVVDALNGIDVYSSKNFRVDDTFFVVGNNHLMGEDALRFARERYSFAGQGDVQRGINQMEVIKAIINKVTSFTMISNYTEILDAVGDCIMTDMPTEELYNLVKFQLATGKSWTFDTFTVTGKGASEITYSIPGAYCYVMKPDEENVEQAKKMIEEVLGN